jgi:gluconate 2-dehydrogenase subunit 3-like protein
MTVVAQRGLLALVLDVLVPASGGLPSAGAVALDHVMAMAAASADLDALLSGGLRAIEEAAGAGGAAGLASLSADDRERVLRRAEESQADFFEALVRLTYEGYYGHPQVVAQLGLDPRPLHPRGHRVEPVDLPDLARVTARGPLYRSP